MDIRLLEYFLVVEAEGNVTKAAQKLHLTQPTLTRQLQQLEQIYGSQLFIRGSRKMTLTHSGVILKRRAQEILDIHRKTILEIEKSENDVSGVLSIGCGESKGNTFLTDFLKDFAKCYPLIKYNLFTAASPQNKEKINDGLIDVAIVLEPIDKQYYDYIPLPYYDQWCVVMKPDAPLAKYDVITKEQLKDLPLALPDRKEVQVRFQEWLGENIEANIVIHFDMNANLGLLIAEGFCYGISIHGAISPTNPNLTYRLLSPKIVSKSYLIWKKGVITNIALSKFIEKAKEVYLEQ